MSKPFPCPDAMKQLACPSNGRVIGRPWAWLTKLSSKSSTEKWATEPALEVGMSEASPMAKMLSCLGQQGVPVDGHEVEVVAEPRTGDVVGAHIERDRDQQVEGDLPLVEGHERLVGGVDPLRSEVALDSDLAFLEDGAQVLGGDRLGEGALQGGRVDDLDPVAHTTLGEEGLGQEGELEGRDGALDGHVDDVHDHPASFPVGELVCQGNSTLVGVKLVDALAELVPNHALCLVRPGRSPGGDDKVVVRELPVVGEEHSGGVGVHPVYLPEDEVYAVADETPTGLDQVPSPVGAEGDEQLPRLVDMVVVLVDDGDLPRRGVEPLAQPVGDRRPRSTSTEDEQSVHLVLLGLSGCLSLSRKSLCITSHGRLAKKLASRDIWPFGKGRCALWLAVP